MYFDRIAQARKTADSQNRGHDNFVSAAMISTAIISCDGESYCACVVFYVLLFVVLSQFSWYPPSRFSKGLCRLDRPGVDVMYDNVC